MAVRGGNSPNASPRGRGNARPKVFTWRRPSPPLCASCALELPRPALVGDRALDPLRRAMIAERPAVVSLPLAGVQPRTIALTIGRMAAASVRSFRFCVNDEAAATFLLPRDGRAPGTDDATGNVPETSAARAAPPVAAREDGEADAPRTIYPPTRVAPPADVIKLEDRLRYVLQPPLESLLAERELRFPFPPFPFQLAGVAFLYPRQAAVLADEMGLGKTMQAVTAIRLLLHRGEVRSVLLVCPKPLVTNWQREFGLWAAEVPLMVVEGDQTRRQWQWQLPDVPLRIANYEVVCRDRELFESPASCGGGYLAPAACAFDLVVLDESQRIKNRGSATSQIVRRIARKRSWALTGTPVENSVEDLVGIFEFLAPGVVTSDMKPRRVGRTVADYVLRRTKDQVLTDMPPKMFCDATLELSPEQRESYRLAEEEGVVRLTEMGEGATIQHVFELVLRLKQICNFDTATGASSKLERLMADMEEIAASGRKALVFSQWVCTLRRLAGALRRFGPLEYHGQVPSAQRDGVIRRFREDSNSHVLLMSYGAGGVGLNLQFANYVFLFDRWWNPAVEDQAINRAHRIGAAGAVTVTRFLMLETIEERIDRVLQEKRDLFETVFSEHEGPGKAGLTQQEFFGLFGLRQPKTHRAAA